MTDSKISAGGSLPLMESFYTLQGEGFHSGLPAYFVRLGGCDLGCHWCDVKESWNEKAHPLTSAAAIASGIPPVAKMVVITGGEPLMWDLSVLTSLLHSKGLRVHIETSGAYPLTGKWNWICLSPKKNKLPLAELYPLANELKVIVHNRHDLIFAEEQAMKVPSSCHLFLQPEWSKQKEMTPLIIDYIKQNPKWRISIQTHKYLGIP